MKWAFIASGGGLGAYAFHVGVMRALEASGFRRRLANAARSAPAADREIGLYVGSSAGACVASAFAFFDSLDDVEGVIGIGSTRHPLFTLRVLFRPHGRWLLPRSLSGLFYADGVERYFRERAHNNDFREIGPELFICATQLNGSRKVVFGPSDSARAGVYDPFIGYYNDVPISEAIAASVSVPLVFQPYRIRNRASGNWFEYTDGEVRETLSLHVARDHAVDVAIASSTWLPYHWDPSLGSLGDLGVFRVLSQSITQMVEQKIDRIRNEADRNGEAIERIREVAASERFTKAQTDRLVEAVTSALRHGNMKTLYVAPERTDSVFALAPRWSFERRHLEYARDLGYDRALAALADWKDADRAAP